MVTQSLESWIYRSAKQEGAHLYLNKATRFEELPAPLQELFADQNQVLELTLTEETRLATEDIRQVLENLLGQGFHLQMRRDAADTPLTPRSPDGLSTD